MSDNKLIDPNYLAEIEKPHEVRLIDANALSAYLKETNWGSELLNIIDNAPTVEAYTEEQIKELIELNKELSEERPKGEWELFNSYYRKCNKCERMVGFDYADHNHGNWFNFCPNCGADMRGGD